MIDLNDKKIVNQIISELTLPDEINRKSHSFDSWQIYSGNQKAYVLDELKRTRPSSWHTYSVSNISISKMAIDRISKAYAHDPIRSIGDEEKNNMLSDIYDEADAKTQMPFADTLLNMHKYFLFWVDYDFNKEKYRFWSLQPHEFSVIRNKKTGDLECVILNYGNYQEFNKSIGLGDGIDTLIADQQVDSSAESKVYAMWTKDQHVVVVSQKKMIETQSGVEIQFSIVYLENPENKENINFLGVLPFVYISKEPVIDYPTPSPLAYNSVLYNALNSELLTAANIQGTSIGTLSYPERYEGKFKNLTSGLTSLVKLPQSSDPLDKPTSLSFQSPSPDLGGQKDSYLTYAKQTLAEYGIDAKGITGDSQSFSSALEKMISEAPIQQTIQQNQNLFSEMEKYIFEIIKEYDKLFGFNRFDIEDELSITFTKPKVMISDSEVLTNLEKMLSLGLIEEWEKFKIIDPNLSDEQAKEKLERINKQKLDKMEMFLGGNTREDNKDNRVGFRESTGEPEESSQE
jgi:hypothetical protein